jgi:hypothetical protein
MSGTEGNCGLKIITLLVKELIVEEYESGLDMLWIWDVMRGKGED